MDDALLRRIAALQAKSILLHDQSEVLTELTDMQALRGFKSGLAEYISDHAQKGTLPPDPLATIRERLSPIMWNLDLIRDQESVIEGVSKHGFSKKETPAVSLQFMAEVQLDLDECRSILCQLQVDLFEGSLAEDWDGEVGDRRIRPEIRECAAVLFPDKELGYRESSLKESIKRIDELSRRVGGLRELHTAQVAVVDEASALLKNQDFRSAISLLQEHKMIAGKVFGGLTSTSAIKFKDISVPVVQINKLASACHDLEIEASGSREGPRALQSSSAQFKAAWARDHTRKLIQRARNLITSPDGEFAREVTPLIAQFEEEFRVADEEVKAADARKKVADARKKTRIIGAWAVIGLLVVLGLIFAILIG